MEHLHQSQEDAMEVVIKPTDVLDVLQDELSQDVTLLVNGQLQASYFRRYAKRDVEQYFSSFNEEHPDMDPRGMDNFTLHPKLYSHRIVIEELQKPIRFRQYLVLLWRAFEGDREIQGFEKKAMNLLKQLCGIRLYTLNKDYFATYAHRDLQEFYDQYNQQHPEAPLDSINDFNTGHSFRGLKIIRNGQVFTFVRYLRWYWRAEGENPNTVRRMAPRALEELKLLAGFNGMDLAYFTKYAKRDTDLFVASYNEQHPDSPVTDFSEFSTSGWFSGHKATINGEERTVQRYLRAYWTALGNVYKEDPHWQTKAYRSLKTLLGFHQIYLDKAYFEEHAQTDVQRYVARFRELYPENRLRTFTAFRQSQKGNSCSITIDGVEVRFEGYLMKFWNAYGHKIHKVPKWRSKALTLLKEVTGYLPTEENIQFYMDRADKDAERFLEAYNASNPSKQVDSFFDFNTMPRFLQTRIEVGGELRSLKSYLRPLYLSLHPELSTLNDQNRWIRDALSYFKGLLGEPSLQEGDAEELSSFISEFDL